MEQVFALLGSRTDATLAEILQSFAPPRRAFAERGLLWLARHDVVAITPAP